ncbi:MAG: 50S ribosomal protein L15 [Robiginitomaculum sp.]|nr:50S ribosomal protein L15 [Robiginitomaculum sp.]MDQ7078618.1 50S ribosomal protein L15 [Robiginitomaculum sp.]
MRLNELSDNPGATPKRLRVGRGPGSGKGKTAGRGVKGQKSRSGVAIKGFEGGQMPLHMRLPKRGFTPHNQARYAELNIGKLQAAIDAKKIDAKKALDEDALVAAGVVRRKRDGIRLLAKGTLKAKVNLTMTGATKAAIAAVEKAGGSVTIAAKKAPEAKAEKSKD